MKYLKLFEEYRVYNHKLIIDDVLYNELKVEIQYPDDAVVVPESVYGIDVIGYFKEIFLDKYITFKSVDTPKGHPQMQGFVLDVDQLAYQDEFYIRVKLAQAVYSEFPAWLGHNNLDDWYIINNTKPVLVQHYDADTKPLHKEVEFKKEAGRYNL
jgi:hypothetical protein